MMSPKFCEGVLQGISRQYPSQEDIHDHLGKQNKPYPTLQYIPSLEISFFHRTALNSQVQVIHTLNQQSCTDFTSLLEVILHTAH